MTGGVLVALSKLADQGNTLAALFYIYTALRYAWLVCYKMKFNEPPLRTLCFGLSKLTILAVLVVSIIIAFEDSNE